MKPLSIRRHEPRRLAWGAAAVSMAVALSLCVSTSADAHGGTGGSPGSPGQTLTVESGDTTVIEETTRLRSLTVADGASLVAPDGYTLSLTVNGVETGQQIVETGGFETVVAPGTYRGNVVLTVAEETPVSYNDDAYAFRQAVYVDADGFDESASVLAAVQGRTPTDTSAKNLSIRSTGEAFNGIVVNDTDYTLSHVKISLTGNGRSDFAGMGAAIMGSGEDTTLVIDKAVIDSEGAVRPAVVATDGANVIVKNSQITTSDGVLPDDYVSSVNTSYMQDSPWMLGISGNNRSTNVLGENTQATYISSSITSENWGALSVDTGSDMKLSAINSTVVNSGEDGYGSYIIGDATETFLGTTFEVATYAAIVTGGSAFYGDSSKEAVAALNDTLELGLTAKELKKLRERTTTITSERFGFMWHSSGSIEIGGGTEVTTEETMFLVKGQAAEITVDGSEGATLDADNGVLVQMIENDDPGPVAPDLTNTGVYEEPTGDVAVNADHDPTVADDQDTTALFSDITVEGDVFNGMRGDVEICSPWDGCSTEAKDLVLTLDGAHLTGVVSASNASHVQSTITADDYRLLGVVTNEASPVINNGVIVSLRDDSTWTVTGDSYLSSLRVEAGSELVGADDADVTVTVDGAPTVIDAGVTYTGDIHVSLG